MNFVSFLLCLVSVLSIGIVCMITAIPWKPNTYLISCYDSIRLTLDVSGEILNMRSRFAECTLKKKDNDE